MLVPSLFVLVVAATPWFTERYALGRWPRDLRGSMTPLAVSGLVLVLGWWIVTLIRREQRNTDRHLGELERLTLTDPLTGLGNRRALERDLPRMMKLSERVQTPLALLYLDVDHFKQINDGFGHAAGDETLRVLGAVLRACSRAGTDTAYRVGGDEFVMTLMADRDGAEALAQRAARDFERRSPRRSALSFGVVAWDGQSSAPALLDRADGRMYERKQGGWAREGAGGEAPAARPAGGRLGAGVGD
ncbi:MAG: GGDEF domain-containing protein [Candidatus Eisenbacteria bacterium]|nr:GGDEF domain-containing protein [Candidatus Eisenbacteria bacterium]